MFLTDTDGNKSLTATMAVIAFVVVMLKLLTAGVSFTLGPISYAGTGMDAATVGTILTPILGAYVGRRLGGQQDGQDDAGSKPGDGR